MRTTLDISDDVLLAAKELAQRGKKPLGQVISELARKAFTLPDTPSPAPGADNPLAVLGIHPLPACGVIISNEHIDRLRDEEGV